MLKERSWMNIFFIAALVAALFGCTSGNSDVSILDNSHSNFAIGTFAAATAHGPLAKASLESCQPCHATPTFGSNPRFNLSHTNMPAGCETCHAAVTAHPTPWLPGRTGTPFNVANATSHATAGNFGTACALCHGASLDGVGGRAPSCTSADPVSGVRCHGTSPAQTPTGCTSCHTASPSGPSDGTAGATTPNRRHGHGKHTQHSIACAACHDTFTSGMVSHANGTTDVPLSNTFQANLNVNVTTFNYDKTARTCSGVSCHGGQTTPDWQVADSITVATDCLKCHELGTALGTPQFNSPFSGFHQSHLAGLANTLFRLTNPVDITCTDCHNTTALALQHFIGLDTQGYGANDSPGNTISGGLTKVITYDKTLRTCLAACHTVPHGPWF